MTLLFETISGSRAYGTAVEGSDTDVRGVFAYLGFVHAYADTRAEETPVDRTLFELRKFFRLAAASNPNVIELLFIEPSNHRFYHPAFERVLVARDMFMSKRAAVTHRGFAISELHKLRKNWSPKGAMHVVRLTRMCLELLTTGKLNVRRPDAEELIAIRQGAWEMSDVEQYATSWRLAMDACEQTTSLPETPDMEALDALCVEVYRDLLGREVSP